MASSRSVDARSEVADEELEAPQLAGESGKVGVGLVVQRPRTPLPSAQRLLELAGMPLRPPEARQDSAAGRVVTTLFEETDRALEVPLASSNRAAAVAISPARSRSSASAAESSASSAACAKYRAASSLAASDEARSPARASASRALTLISSASASVRRAPYGIQVVRRDNLDNLRSPEPAAACDVLAAARWRRFALAARTSRTQRA